MDEKISFFIVNLGERRLFNLKNNYNFLEIRSLCLFLIFMILLSFILIYKNQVYLPVKMFCCKRKELFTALGNKIRAFGSPLNINYCITKSGDATYV